jgi:hypothetical protein
MTDSKGELVTGEQGNEKKYTAKKGGQVVPITTNPHFMLIQTAIEKGADIGQLEKLMDLQERYEANQAKRDFNEAMSKFQGLLPVIEKTGVVDFTSSKGRTHYDYAKLEDIAKAIRPALKETGLSYRFSQSQSQGQITVYCIVTHASGHSETSELTSQPDISGGKEPLKAIASTISYLRRYTLTGSLGIVVGGEDDDAGSEAEVEAKELAFYPDEDFQKNFPNWEKSILTGKRTAAQLIKSGEDQGIVFTKLQKAAIENIGAGQHDNS